MMFEKAMNFIHCSGWELGAWITVVLCVIVCIQYLAIVVYWRKFDNRSIAKSLQMIFVMCAVCGYFTVIASAFQSAVKYAYAFRLCVALPSLVIANQCFLYFARDKSFKAKSSHDDRALLDAVTEAQIEHQVPRNVIIESMLLQVRDAKSLIDKLETKSKEVMEGGEDE